MKRKFKICITRYFFNLILLHFNFYSYLTIVTEILSVIIRKYWHFLDFHFTNGEFLVLLLQYTFRQEDLDYYYQCLDIWCSIFEALSDRPECVEK